MIFRGLALVSGGFSLVLTALTGGFSGYDWLWRIPCWFAAAFAAGTVLVLLFAVAAIQLVDENKPQEHDSKFYRFMTELLLEMLIPMLRVRLEPQGMERIPKQGRFLVVCNHLSLPDPAVLLYCFRGCQLAFVSKRENNQMFLVGKLMHKLMCQLINRENDREALKTILRCIRLLKEDETSVAVFPEGRTSPDGRLCHFRSGVFKIAQKASVPIVVCTVKNTKQMFHNALHLRPTHVPIHLVDVIQPEDFRDKTTVEIAGLVYEKMISDLGEEFRSIEN